MTDSDHQVSLAILENHNDICARIPRHIIESTLQVGGGVGDILMALESVLIGIVIGTIKPEDDEKALNLMFESARDRLSRVRAAERMKQQLLEMPPQGSA